jgi:hypothetical protein
MNIVLYLPHLDILHLYHTGLYYMVSLIFDLPEVNSIKEDCLLVHLHIYILDDVILHNIWHSIRILPGMDLYMYNQCMPCCRCILRLLHIHVHDNH